MVVVVGALLMGHDNLLGLSSKFDPRYETSVHAWLGSTLLLSCAVALVVIRQTQPDAKWRSHWAVLSAGFALLSLDEVAELHERLLDLSKSVFGPNSPEQLWTVFGLAACLIIGAAFLPFIVALPKRFRFQTIAAGVMFVGGAVCCEMVVGLYEANIAPSLAVHMWLAVVEEGLELAGVAFFFVSLVQYGVQLQAGRAIGRAEAAIRVLRPVRTAYAAAHETPLRKGAARR
jgi:hypothetical protein